MFRFAVMSDIHVQAWDSESQERFIAALQDYDSLTNGLDFIVINGDLTEGFDEDYVLLKELLGEHAKVPVYVTIGNHEYYKMWYKEGRAWSTESFPNGWSTELAKKSFLDAFGLDRPYYDVWSHDHHFIFLAGEHYRDANPLVVEHAWISDEQFAFLCQALQERRGGENGVKPVFVFVHQTLPAVYQHKELEALLNEYPEVILFSGDSHYQLLSESTYCERGFATMNSSSVRRPWSDRNEPLPGTISESVLVEVSESEVKLLGRRHDEKRWLEEVQFVRNYPRLKLMIDDK